MSETTASPATVWLNGERRKIRAASTIAELFGELQIPVHALLVEHNGSALHRDEWATRKIQQDDRIEIVHIVAGG